MELMKTSLDKFYKAVSELHKIIPEKVLGKITFAVSTDVFVVGKFSLSVVT